MQSCDPTDLRAINECIQAWATGAETIHPVRIDRIAVADSVIDILSDEVRRLSGHSFA